MATTENGVYYQDDYTKIADILADMEKMAESIDELIEKAKYDDTDVKNNIKTIQDEQKVQNDNIEDIQTKDTEQDKLIQKLQANMIQESTEEATSLHVEDASNLPAVLSVRGNHYQEVKNSINELHLIDTPETNLGNRLSYKIEDETIILNGSVESTYALVITTQSNIVDLVKAGEEWTLSAYGENMPAENTFVRITTASNANVLQALLNSTIEEGSNSTTFTENSATVRIMLAANAVYNNSKIKIKLEKGGTKTDYDKYCKMPSIYIPSEIETVKDNIKIIQCNSNFLKKQEETEITENGITGKVLDDGSIVLNGTTQYATYIQITEELQIGRIATGQNFKKYVLPKGSYKFNCQVSGQASDSNLNAYIRNSVNASSFSQALNRLPENSFKEIEFTTDKEEYVAYVWINSGITLTDFTLKFMLKRADDNSEYIQNEQKEYNLAVQKEMLLNDKFNLLNNKEMNGWNKTILNGTENWQQSSVISSVFFLDMQNTTQDKTKFELISNQYSYGGIIVNSNQAKHNKIYGFISEGILRQRILLRNDNFTTLDSFKASLAEKNMTLYYVASTTTELDLTEEQKQVLNELNNLELFKGTNNIYTEQDLALLQLDYTADTKMYIDNKIASQNREG